MQLPRMPGQKETRYVHLLSGEPDLSKLEFRNTGNSSATSNTELEARVETLESEVAELRDRLEQLLKDSGQSE
jgi:hypothetical protein